MNLNLNIISNKPVRPVYRFRDFALFAAERRLERQGTALPIGGRAFDVLTILLERAGEPVSKQEIASRAWPDVTVGESSLRVQITSLRRLLDDGEDEGSLITTLSGRGYVFVAPVQHDHADGRLPAIRSAPLALIPPRPCRIIGRSQEISTVISSLVAKNFVTLIGPGGVGKTILAHSVAHEISVVGDKDIHFLDLAALRDAKQLGSMVASALGLSVNAEDLSAAIIGLLRARRALLILDSCDHVIEAVAELAERIFAGCPGIMLLATSREALRVEGEQAVQLAPFDCPPTDQELTADQLLTYPASELFMERAAAAGCPIVLNQSTIGVVAEICRKVDGLALALEIAASRVPSFGLHGTLALLNDHFRFLSGGRRTAVSRHRTLADTLAWSHDMLEEVAKTALHRLSVLVGEFDLDLAIAAIIDETLPRETAIKAIGALTAKSLLQVRQTGMGVRYRLFDTTRAFACSQLQQQGVVTGPIIRSLHR